MTALDDIAFLTDSVNRVAALKTLTTGPHKRSDLQETIGVSRSTIKRILGGFRERGWVVRDGHEYALTPLGEFIATEFQSLLEGAETMRKLRGVVEWLPTNEFDFTLDHFADATITTPRPNDPTAPIRRATALIHEANHIRFLCTAFAPSMYDAIWQRTVHDDQTAVGVMATELIDAIREESRTFTVLRETIASNEATLYQYEGQFPYDMAVFDETIAGLLVVDEGGHVHAVIDTEDEAVRSWVGSTIDAHQREAHRLDPDMFTV